MPNYDIGQTTTSSLTGSVLDVKIAAQTPDAGSSKEIRWNFPDADKHLGYYKTIPELKSALHVFSQRVAGLGWITDPRTTVILENVIGWGEDSFDSIMRMMVTEKKVFGDAFAEIVRNDGGLLLNLKKLYTGDMEVILGPEGIIMGYEQRSNVKGGAPKKFKPNQILHLSNDRISNEIHGSSIIDSLKFYIDFYNELIRDERKIRHRELALGIIQVDTNDATKMTTVKNAHRDAIKNGEALVVGDGVKLLDNPNQPRDRLQIMNFVINQFYQVVGTPKILTTSEGFTEAGGKAGLLAFEPTELAEKRELEQDLWNQLGIRIKFTRTPSLLGEAVGTEQKNAGQTGIQPNETSVSATRTE